METEITVQVFNNLDEIKNILANLGFDMIENYQLNDWYFSKFDNISKLNYDEIINSSFLVRQIIDSNEQVQLCYKKKTIDNLGNVVCEEKTKALLSDLNSTLSIFKSANLNNYCTLKNNSFVYKKANISFALQCIEDLGIFIEYEEDDTMKEMTENEKIAHMISLVKTFGLKLGNDYLCKKMFMKLKK